MRTTRILSGVVVAAAVAVAGCGGDDDKGLSKADYVKQANAICKAVNGQVQAAAQAALGADATPDDLKAFAADRFVPAIERELVQLRALKAPKDDADTVSAIYAAVDKGLAATKSDPTAITRGGSASPFADANAKANAYGLTECGSSS